MRRAAPLEEVEVVPPGSKHAPPPERVEVDRAADARVDDVRGFVPAAHLFAIPPVDLRETRGVVPEPRHQSREVVLFLELLQGIEVDGHRHDDRIGRGEGVKALPERRQGDQGAVLEVRCRRQLVPPTLTARAIVQEPPVVRYGMAGDLEHGAGERLEPIRIPAGVDPENTV